jgi:hypothetical protein
VGLFQCVRLKCGGLLACFAIDVVFWLV